MSESKKGFTLVELMVTVPIALLVIGAVVFVLFSLVNQTMSKNEKVSTVRDLQNALDIIEQDVSLSNSFLATNDFTLDPSQKNNNDNWTNLEMNNSSVLILQKAMTTTNPLSEDVNRKLVRTKIAGVADCAGNPLMFLNVVYFVNNNNLYRRTLMPTNYATDACEPPFQRPSCTTPNTSFCQNEDMLLLKNIDNFEILYLDDSETLNELSEAKNNGLNNTQRQNVLDQSHLLRVNLSTKFQAVEGEKPEILSGKLLAGRIR